MMSVFAKKSAVTTQTTTENQHPNATKNIEKLAMNDTSLVKNHKSQQAYLEALEMTADSPPNADRAVKSSTKSTVFTPNVRENLIKVLAALGLFLVGWLMVNGIRHLPPANIVVNPQGLTQNEQKQLQQALGTTADSNLLQADLSLYQQKAQSLSWIDQLHVARVWQQPSQGGLRGIVVTAVPRQPVAKFGSEKLVDATGKVFTPADAEQLNGQHWKQLQGDADKAPLIMQQTQQITQWFAPLGLNVAEVILTPRMTWLVRFDNGLRVLVDKDNTSEKLHQLSLVLANQLREKLPRIQTLDLRYKNGMALTWRASVLPNPDDKKPNERPIKKQ